MFATYFKKIFMKKTFLPLIIFFFSLNFSIAQWIYTNGPDPAGPNSVFNLAANSTTVFTGIYDGVHAYSNSNWALPANTGFPPQSASITALTAKGTDLFAAFQIDGGVFISSDSANSWVGAYNGLPTNFGQLYAVNALSYFDLTHPLFAGTEVGVYSTTNNGTSWTAAGLSTSDIRALATNGNEIFAGTYGDGVFYSSNNGGSWTAINTGLTDTIILSLLHAGGSTVYAGTYHGVYKTTNNGNTWAQLNTNGAPTNAVYAFVMVGSTIITGVDGGVFVSNNGGINWITANTGLTIYDVRALAIQGGNLYAGVGQGGVWVRALNQITAINELGFDKNSVSIYPNPASATASLYFSHSLKNASIQLLNITGQVVLKKEKINGNSFDYDISSLSTGIYFAEIKEDESVVRVKLIKN